MKTLFTTIGSVALSGLLMPTVSAADALRPDSDGYIRDWVMLAPIALPEGKDCGDLLLEEQVKNEAALRPKAGDTITLRGKELTWKHITASTNYFDLNAILESLNDRAAGYMVTYIECDEKMTDVTMALGSNDQGRLYLNGVDIYAYQDARPLELDADKGNVTLNKGVNAVVFKIINEQNSWQGAMRFLDKAGAAVTDLKIKLSPLAPARGNDDDLGIGGGPIENRDPNPLGALDILAGAKEVRKHDILTDRIIVLLLIFTFTLYRLRTVLQNDPGF